MSVQSKQSKQAKKQKAIEKQLQECVRKGWLFIDGERDGMPLYKPTRKGLILAQKRMKGLGLQVSKVDGEEAADSISGQEEMENDYA